MMEQGKQAALAASVLALLLYMFGLCLPLQTAEVGSIDFKFGIRDQESSGTTTNTWTADCSSNDDLCKAQHMLKAAFAMIFIGYIANLVAIASLVVANGYTTALPAPLGQKMPTVGAAVVACVFYLIGLILAVTAYPTAYDKNISAGQLDLTLGAGSVLLIIGYVAAVAAAALSFTEIEDGPEPAKDAAPAAAIGAPPTADVEAPVTDVSFTEIEGGPEPAKDAAPAAAIEAPTADVEAPVTEAL